MEGRGGEGGTLSAQYEISVSPNRIIVSGRRREGRGGGRGRGGEGRGEVRGEVRGERGREGKG